MALRTAAFCLIAFLVAGGYLVSRVGQAFGGACENRIARTVSSPDNAVKAVVFERDCGATAGFSEQVSVLAAGAALPNEGANVFVADDSHGVAPQGPQVRAVWKDDTHLLITHHHKARVFHAETKVRVDLGLLRGARTVTISYQK